MSLFGCFSVAKSRRINITPQKHIYISTLTNATVHTNVNKMRFSTKTHPSYHSEHIA